ncbi:hypothetical protein CRM22_006046 [Opisthorchis felineus]|uniref:Peptidase A1 domain-containing protein n=1 Tax=Opisthorchis felineus TaxID=147828 RepID=A0A4S2LN06_OPIFE|nr:hypothetical protein CRM22_006046 [Opisthorchis felineus]
MLLDTGSSSIWVPSDRVDKRLWLGKNLLNLATATSVRVSGEFFYQLYISGDVGGLKATVDMNFGGMLIKNVPFGMVIGGAKEVYDSSFDGIIGLGRRSMCPEHTEPVFHFFSQEGIMSRKFGFHFQDSGASFMMGDNLEQFLSPDMTYVNVVDGPYWETRVDWIFVSKTGFSTENHRMVFDTGASGIHLPGDIHMAMNELLGIRKLMNREYLFDCERLHFLPPVAFQLQGKTFKIMPEQYTKQTSTDGDTTCTTHFYNVTANSLAGIVLGMSFLRSFQLIFDDQTGRVGFAARAGRSSIT